MPRHRRPNGECKLCGTIGPLSWEHTPPKAAFNNEKVFSAKFDAVVGLGPGDRPRAHRTEQKGMGAYSLCERCNNNTGQWYAKWFIAWCYQGLEILSRTKGKPHLVYPQYLFPLPVIKQVITMFFTVNQLGFARANPDLVQFILNPDRRYLDPKYRVFAYYNIEGGMRSTGIVIRGNVGPVTSSEPGTSIFSELNYPPFGYVFSYDGTKPDRSLTEITHFSRYAYGELKMLNLDLQVLPTHLWIPGDYRTKEQILADYEKNISDERNLPNS